MTKLKDISGYEEGLDKIFFDPANAEVGIDEEEILLSIATNYWSSDKESCSDHCRRIAKSIIKNESKILRIKNGT